jgi:hypothetical protein
MLKTTITTQYPTEIDGMSTGKQGQEIEGTLQESQRWRAPCLKLQCLKVLQRLLGLPASS